ncbi:MAG: hypothetical protein JWQ49_718 [Edaphobacter sp.]|nr:hypothetical protein [Edaphobacter sp.]
MIVFSNHPHHYAIRDPDPEQHLLSVVSQQPHAHPPALRSLHVAAELYGNIPMGFSTEEGDPPPPAVPALWPKVRYDLQVEGTDVSVLREGKVFLKLFRQPKKTTRKRPANCTSFWRTLPISRGRANDLYRDRRRQFYFWYLRSEIASSPGSFIDDLVVGMIRMVRRESRRKQALGWSIADGTPTRFTTTYGTPTLPLVDYMYQVNGQTQDGSATGLPIKDDRINQIGDVLDSLPALRVRYEKPDFE